MKTFRNFLNSSPSQLEEAILNKAYALSQNSQFAAIRRKANAVSSNLHSLTQNVKAADDIDKKIDLLAEAIDKINHALLLQNDLSMTIQNVSVANILFSDDLKTLLKTEIEKLKRGR